MAPRQDPLDVFAGIVFNWLATNCAFDAAAELVAHLLNRISIVESVNESGMKRDAVKILAENWTQAIRTASSCFAGCDEDRVLELLKELESADSQKEFVAHLSSKLEAWSDLNLNAVASSGDWLNRSLDED